MDMVPTVARGQSLGVLAGWTVAQSLDTLDLLRSSLPARRRALAYALRTLRNVIMAAGELAGYALGAGVGTLVRPGRGTYIGQVVGGAALIKVVDLVLTQAGLPPPAGALPAPDGDGDDRGDGDGTPGARAAAAAAARARAAVY